MSDIINLDSLLVELPPEKLAQFQQWCQAKNLDIHQVISQLIDSCLGQNLELIRDLIPLEKKSLSYQEIELMIAQSLQPLIKRLDLLEKQLKHLATKSSLAQVDSQDNLDSHNQKESEIILTNNLSPNEEERKYLPRNQVWQMLKQTDYVKYCGYDSFLSASPEQFSEYGIFFDTDKKRYYIITQSETKD
jgi:hypothetical protein